MALSTLRLRASQSSSDTLRQYPQRPSKPTAHDVKEILELTNSLRKVHINENISLPVKKPVLPDIVPVIENSGSNESLEQDITFPNLNANKIEFDEDIDFVCRHIDEKFLTDFLRRSQIMLNVLVHWYWDSTNSIEFLHWWLTNFDRESREDWLKLECGILLEEINSCIDHAGQLEVEQTRVMKFILAVLPEHQEELGAELERLPDTLEILVSGDKFRYCSLLSRVMCRTSKQEIALATRTYCIVSICYNAIMLYKKLISNELHVPGRPISRSSLAAETYTKPGRPSSSRPISRCSTSRPMSAQSTARPTTAQNLDRVQQYNITRAFDSVTLGYVEVLQYLFEKGYINEAITDNTGRNLVFVAVVHGQLRVLNQLLSRDSEGVNSVADSGNTPLHNAATAGNAIALNILLKAGANPHLYNPECNGATALHLAVLHGHTECVVLLLGAGASPLTKMGCPATTSAVDLARDTEQTEILELLLGAFGEQEDDKIERV